MAIAFVNGATNETASTVSTLTVTYSPTKGNTVVVGVSLVKTGLTSIVCKDNFGNSLGLGAVKVTGGNPTSVLFYYIVPQTGVTGFTATWNTTSAVSMAAVEYSGVVSIKGLPGNTATGAATAPTITVNTEDNNDWVVGVIVGNAALTLSTGNSRESSALPAANRILIADNTVATAGSVTIACSATVAEWAITLIELKLVSFLFQPDAEETIQSTDQQMRGYFIRALEADYDYAPIAPAFGFGGQNMSGFRGFWSLRAAMQEEDWSYDIINIRSGPDSLEDQPIPQQLDFYINNLDTDFDTSQSTFFRLEEYWEDMIQEPEDQGFVCQAAMQDEDWSFNPPVVVTVKTPFDEDQFVAGQFFDIQDIEDWGFNLIVAAKTPFDEDELVVPPTPDVQWVEDDQNSILITSPAVDEQFEIITELPIQTTDEDTSQSTFFAREEYPDADEQPLYQQQKVCQDVESDQPEELITSPVVDEQFTITVQLPQYDTDEDIVQSTFFAKEQYADNDEQFYQYQPPVPAMQEYDLFVFGVFVGALPAMPYDTDEYLTQQISYYFGDMDEEEFNWGWLPPLTKVSEDEDQYMTIPQLVYPRTDNDESWGFLPPVGFGGQNMSGFRGYRALRAGMGSDDDWSFNPPVVVTVKEGFDGDDGFTLQIYDLDIDDSWGYNPIIVGTGGTQLMGFRGYWTPKMAMAPAEDEQVYPNAPFLTPFPSDDSPEQYAKAWVQYDDVDLTNFAEVLIDDGSQDRMLPSIFIPDDDLFVFGVFVAPLPIMPFDADFNHAMQTSYFFSDMDTEEHDWGFKPPTVLVAQDDSPYDSYVKQVLVYDDMEQFGFNQPVVTVINAFAPEEDIPSQYRIYDDVELQGQDQVIAIDDNQEPLSVRPVVDDIEQFVSHSPFIPPTAEVWELDGLPANLPYLYEDDVETFGWVKAIAYPSHILDDEQAPHFPFWSLAWADDDLSLTTPPPVITGLVPIIYKVMSTPTVQMELQVSLSTQVADINIGATVLSNLGAVQFINVENASIFSGVIVLSSFAMQIQDIIISNSVKIGAILVQN